MTKVTSVLTKRVVCLANSRKLSGRCIAGKEIQTGTWIRPVSARASQEVSESERNYADGTDPAVLDVIDIPLLEPRPKGYQSENWLLDPKYYWHRTRVMRAADLMPLIDKPSALWVNGMSSQAGRNDRVDTATAAGLDVSLYLIDVDEGVFHVFAPGASFGNIKRRVQLTFEHRGEPYALWVTDPLIERDHLRRPDGEYPLGASFLTISLGEPISGYAYKLVAAVIPNTTGA
jgi:hypothetical protein